MKPMRKKMLLALSSVIVIVSIFFNNNKSSALMIIALSLLSLVFLYQHINDLTETKKDSKTVYRQAMIITIFIILIITIAVIIMKNNTLSFLAERNLAVFIMASIILLLGYIAPKLPWNRYIGLRLPWTVVNEKAWNAAHRLLGYLSIPFVICYLVVANFTDDFIMLSVFVFLVWIAIPSILSFAVYRNDVT